MLETLQDLLAPPRHMILVIAAAWLGLTLAEQRAERHGISKDDLNNITFYGLLAFVASGRILFILQNLPIFTKKPLDIVSINPDLFDPFGALIFAALAAFIYGQRKGLRFWSSLDALTPFFAVLAIGMGSSRLVEGTIHGTPTSLPWGIQFQDELRHPINLYDVIASVMILGLVLRFQSNLRPGVSFLTFASLTAGSQLLLQGFRANSTLLLEQYQSGQIIAWVALFISFFLLEGRLSKESKAG